MDLSKLYPSITIDNDELSSTPQHPYHEPPPSAAKYYYNNNFTAPYYDLYPKKKKNTYHQPNKEQQHYHEENLTLVQNKPPPPRNDDDDSIPHSPPKKKSARLRTVSLRNSVRRRLRSSSNNGRRYYEQRDKLSPNENTESDYPTIPLPPKPLRCSKKSPFHKVLLTNPHESRGDDDEDDDAITIFRNTNTFFPIQTRTPPPPSSNNTKDLYSHDVWMRRWYYNSLCQSHVIVGHPGLNIHRLRLPLHFHPLLDQIVAGCEEEAKILPNGWETNLYSLTKQDMALRDVPEVFDIARPIMSFIKRAAKYIYGYNSLKVDRNQPHVLKYSAEDDKGYTGVELHHDKCDITINMMLSRSDSYEGGGTYFPEAKQTVRLEYGEFLLHPGTCVHGGVNITRGTRFIMVTFANEKK